jgi:hypothetical protein
VDTTEIALLEPAVRAWLDDAAPDAVLEPATVMEPPATFAVGVRVRDATAFTTVAVYVYVPDAKLGANVPVLSTSVFSSASALVDAVLVTTTV